MKRARLVSVGVVAASVALAACGGLPGLPGAASSGSGSQSQSAQAQAERVQVSTGTIDNQIIATGKIVARATVDVVLQSSGKVTAVLVKEGDLVKAGQPLATLDMGDQELTVAQQYASYISAQAAYSETIKGGTSAQVKSARAALASAQANYGDLFKAPSDNSLASLKASLLNAEAALKQKQAAYDNAFRRNPAGIGGTAEALALEQATNDYNAARANYDKSFDKPATGSVASAAAQIASARASLDALTPVTETVIQAKAKMDQAYAAWQLSQRALQNGAVVAPFNGLVTAMNLVAGGWANANSVAATVADFDEPIFEVQVDEADLGNVKTGQDAVILLQTYPNARIPARVDSVSTVGANNGTIVTFKVNLVVPKDVAAASTTPKILLGMSGTSEVITSKVDNAVLVPNRALVVNSAARSFSVLRVGSGGIETVPVTLGLRGADNSQVLSGVNAGDMLIIPTNTASSSSQSGGGFFAGPGGGAPRGPGD